MAENIPFGYAPRGMGQQRSPAGNMRYSAMGMGAARPQPAANNTAQPKAPSPPPPREPGSPLRDNTPRSLLSMLGINGLDEEKLILIALIVILAKSGADWVILAALIYSMM